MAYADYRLCDICECKAFYDSNLNYDFPDKNNPIPEENLIRDCHYSLDYLGDWAVICRECAKTHKTIVVPLDQGDNNEV